MFRALLVAILLAAFGWSYWPNSQLLTTVWQENPDYAHGFLVIPLALSFLWLRGESFPQTDSQPALVGGILLVCAAVCLRYLGGRLFLESLDHWSILPWVAGAVAAIWGWRVLWWSLPSIAFLFFMIPPPFRVETALRQPLQMIATKLSCFGLIVLGQPAVAESNVIRLGDVRFGVAEACSGLRIFMGITAFAFAYVVVFQRSWLVKLIFLISVFPVAIVANALRIIAICLVSQYASQDVARSFAHDFAGVVTIPLALALLGLVHCNLGRLFGETTVTSDTDLARISLERNGLVDTTDIQAVQ